MRRYTGLSAHRYGDLFINLAAIRTLKRLDPDSHFTFLLNGNYRDAAPLFLDQPDIDQVHITHSPVGDFDAVDVKWFNEGRFFKGFPLMADHNHGDPWWFHRNQPQEIHYMHGVPIPADEDGKLSLNRWFNVSEGFSDYVAFHGFAGSYDPHNKKQFTPARAQEIVDLIRAKGFKVLQLGLANEPKLEGTLRFDSIDYFSSVKNVLGCRALVIGDSGMNWMASCYDHPTLGLYSHEYYGEVNVKAIQPINPNARYLAASNINDITLDQIEAQLDILLS